MTASDYMTVITDAGELYAPLFGVLLAWILGVISVRLIIRQFRPKEFE